MSRPRARSGVLVGLALAMLGAAAAGGENAAGKTPPEPDPGLLEFLGSVDGLAEVSPDYLAQADRERLARASARGRAASAPPPPPVPPSQSAPGVKN